MNFTDRLIWFLQVIIIHNYNNSGKIIRFKNDSAIFKVHKKVEYNYITYVGDLIVECIASFPRILHNYISGFSVEFMWRVCLNGEHLNIYKDLSKLYSTF